MLQRRASQVGHTDPSIIAAKERAFMDRLESDRTRIGPDGRPRLQRTLNAPGDPHGPGNITRLNMLASSIEELGRYMMAEHAHREQQEHRLQKTHRNTDIDSAHVDRRINVLRGIYRNEDSHFVSKSERWRFRDDLETEKVVKQILIYHL